MKQIQPQQQHPPHPHGPCNAAPATHFFPHAPRLPSPTYLRPSSIMTAYFSSRV